MAKKRLGASAPAADTDTDVYTVPASTETIVSSIFACNRGIAAADIRIAVRDGTIANEDYLYYDLSVPAKETFKVTAGITMDASDVITVRASTADCSFSAFGEEFAV